MNTSCPHDNTEKFPELTPCPLLLLVESNPFYVFHSMLAVYMFQWSASHVHQCSLFTSGQMSVSLFIDRTKQLTCTCAKWSAKSFSILSPSSWTGNEGYCFVFAHLTSTSKTCTFLVWSACCVEARACVFVYSCMIQ